VTEEPTTFYVLGDGITDELIVTSWDAAEILWHITDAERRHPEPSLILCIARVGESTTLTGPPVLAWARDAHTSDHEEEQ